MVKQHPVHLVAPGDTIPYLGHHDPEGTRYPILHFCPQHKEICFLHSTDDHN